MLMLQMVIKHLQHNKKRLISDLVEIVKLVLSASEGEEMDIGKLEQKLETTAEKKRGSLICTWDRIFPKMTIAGCPSVMIQIWRT